MKIMILGAGISQLPTIQAANRLGITSVVVDGSIDALFKSKADIFYVVDIKDHEKVFEIAQKEKIDGVICSGTDFPFTAAYVANKMSLPGISMSSALICSNKHLQRKELREKGFYVPNFVLIENIKEINKIRGLKYPLVIKPVDNMAARGARAVFNLAELESAYFFAVNYSRSKKVIIEEFVEGMEFSIDALSFNNEVDIYAFADRHFILFPYFIENGHTCPTIIDSETRNYCETEYKKAVKSLGINIGASKGDVKLTEKGFMFGEIAARISGGFLSGWTYPFSTGINQHENLIRVHIGKSPEPIKEQKLGFSAERLLLSIPGKVKEIINLENAKKYDGVKLIHLHIKEGSEVDFPYNNALRCGSVLSFNKSRPKAIFEAQIATSNIIFRLEPNNEKTKKWLETDNDFQMYRPGKEEVDWHGADIQKGLALVKRITKSSFSDLVNTKNFWKYFYKGGIQGAIYCLDSFR
jgi:biotin carboxylase